MNRLRRSEYAAFRGLRQDLHETVRYSRINLGGVFAHYRSVVWQFSAGLWPLRGNWRNSWMLPLSVGVLCLTRAFRPLWA